MTVKWYYRVTVPPGQLDHLPAAVGPDTTWLPAASLSQAKSATAATAHAMAQCLGRGVDPGGDWHVMRDDAGREAHHYVLRDDDDTISAVRGEIRRAR